jgi:hypothetical protein
MASKLLSHAHCLRQSLHTQCEAAMLEQAQSQDITHQAATTFAASCNEFLTRPIVRSVSMFLGILAVTIAITNAVSLQWIIEATLTDIGPNSGLYSTAIQIAACLFFTSILVVFPKARKSVHGELSSLGILTFAVMGWASIVWGDIEGITPPLLTLSYDTAAYVVVAVVAYSFVEVFTSSAKVESRLRNAAVYSVFYSGVAAWVLVLIFAFFGSFLEDVIPVAVEHEVHTTVRALTPEEVKNLVECNGGDSGLVICRLPPAAK